MAMAGNELTSFFTSTALEAAMRTGMEIGGSVSAFPVTRIVGMSMCMCVCLRFFGHADRSFPKNSTFTTVACVPFVFAYLSTTIPRLFC